MSFKIALSGLTAASAELSVTANNIANANTTGFKQSRAEFADFFPQSSYGLSQNAIGAGVRLERVAQQFTQGNVNFTDNALDLAISGEGFFTVSDGGATLYTRAGEFGTNRDGYVVNASGHRLQVFPPNAGGAGFDTSRTTDLRLSGADNPPAASGSVEGAFNLPANAVVPTVGTFDPDDAESYNQSTALTLFDSLGATHAASLYFIKTANPNEWSMQVQIDGTPVGPATTLQYSDTGTLVSPAGGQIALPAYTPANGSAPISLNLDIGASTQYGEGFAVSRLSQDGFATGRLAGIDVGEGGVVQARYTNGQSAQIGQVAMANFPNPQGLQQVGATAWAQSFNSGSPVIGAAGTGNFGDVQSGALEASNVDLTAQLVNMIEAQRNFQANAQMISTSDQITQTVLNIR